MSESSLLSARLEEMKQSFDRSFAEAPVGGEQEQIENLLSIRVASDAYAVRLGETSGLYVNRKVVGLPSPMPELMGMAGFRGSVIPVFDLAACLGYGVSDEAGRWLLLAGKNGVIGFSFQSFDGHLRAAAADLAHPERNEPARGRHIREVVVSGGTIRPVIDLVSVVRALKERVAKAGSLEGAL